MPLSESSHVPLCTYRVQLNGKFSFHDLGALTPYFRTLGISDFYLSPIFTATPGSSHGYDVTDYGKVNPELGGGDGFDLLASRLRTEGFGILLDFVPNHMGIAGLLNQWWRDILENGRLSPYESFFDIHWKQEDDGRPSRVLVPVLDDHYGRVLERGGIKLSYGDEFSLRYGEIALPVSPETYAQILAPLGASDAFTDDDPLTPLIVAFSVLPQPETGPDPTSTRKREEMVVLLKKQTAEVINSRPDLQAKLAVRLEAINGTPDKPESFDELHALIERQHYRLVRWKTGAHEINYRRFFAIDSLVGLHMEKPEVFRACHELVGRLVREGKVAGLRIDHIDGLRQPEAYLRRLQSLERPDASRPLYLLVEKILARNEALPDTWPVHGTTGYEFIPQLASILTDAGVELRLDEIYRDFTRDAGSYQETVYEKKRMIIAELFVNAVSNLGHELVALIAADRRWRDLSRHELTSAVGELMANLPVYRTYRKRSEPVSSQDRQVIETACARAIARNPRADPEPFEFVRDLLAGDYPGAGAAETYRTSLLNWVLTFQQYTGAVMAKAVEDTAYYTYNRFVAVNEVGGTPENFGGTVESFHHANSLRLALGPHTMLTTSTHDTKLSEDVRARLYALSELADEWENWLRQWERLTLVHTTDIDGRNAPDSVDRYRFYQILLGVWPLDADETGEMFRGRLREHLRKSVNEAKRHTSILQANEAYLAACDGFVDGVVGPVSPPAFLNAFVPCAQRIARLGVVNSLTQLVLKCTVPGVPDFYQGNEIWDFSLVDPDNRREIDFDRRKRLLEALPDQTVGDLLNDWRTGSIKLHVMRHLLHFRASQPRLFSAGAYQPVASEGAFGEHVVAFTRSHEHVAILVVVPRLTAKLGSPPLGLVWDDTHLVLGPDAGSWQDLFTGRLFSADEPLMMSALFSELPFAVLQSA